MPDAIIYIKAELTRKQFLSYQPSEEDRKRLLTIFAQGYIGKTYQEGCASVTGCAPIESIWWSCGRGVLGGVGYRGVGQCVRGYELLWKTQGEVSMAAVKRVQVAAQGGEFFVAVFSGAQNTKTYKIKHKHQAKLGLN